MKFILLLVLALTLLPARSSVAQVLIVGGEYPPHVIQGRGTVEGIIPEIIRASFKASNIDVKISLLPWKRCEDHIKKGKAFAALPYLRTPKRAESYDFSAPILSFYPKFFYRKEAFPNGFKWKTLSDFKSYLIGGVSGYWYEEYFQEIGLAVEYGANDRVNINKLINDRVNFTLIDETVGWHLINELFPFQDQMDAFAVSEKPESVDALRLMISRTYPNTQELKQAFNQGLQTIRENHIYDQIIKQHQVSEHYSLP